MASVDIVNDFIQLRSIACNSSDRSVREASSCLSLGDKSVSALMGSRGTTDSRLSSRSNAFDYKMKKTLSNEARDVPVAVALARHAELPSE